MVHIFLLVGTIFVGVGLSGNQNFSPRICDSQAILPLDLYLYRLMTWPPFGNCVNCVMKALHNFIAWSFLFEIVMRFSSPSLLKKIVTFLEKSLQKCTRKKPMIWSKNTQISIPPPTSKGTITAAQVGWIGV